MPAVSFHAQLDAAMKRGYIAAFRLLGDPNESLDVCQDAAAKALAARHRYDPSQPFYPWFYRILRNLCMDRHRRASVHRRTADDLRTRSESCQADRPDHKLEAARREQAVSIAIQGLSPSARELIELRHFQDLSYQEMADVLNIPIGTVMSRLHRARKELRERLLADPRGWFGEGEAR